MAQVTYSFRIDENLKKQAEAFCDEVGMNLSTAIMLYLKRITKEQRLPFVVEASDSYFSGANLRHIEAAIAEFDDPSKPKIVKTIAELEAMENE